jgi:hypothetical protein
LFLDPGKKIVVQIERAMQNESVSRPTAIRCEFGKRVLGELKSLRSQKISCTATVAKPSLLGRDGVLHVCSTGDKSSPY